jgi:hypothetical protein
MSRKKNEQHRREAAREYMQAKDLGSIERPVLPREVYENTVAGKMALALVAGTEPAHELFTLIMRIMLVAMRGMRITTPFGDIDDLIDTIGSDDFPIPISAPYYPKTLAIVQHLEKLGVLKLDVETAAGRLYNLVIPDDAGQAWVNEVLNEMGATEIVVEPGPVANTNTFTGREQVELMNSVGIPTGSSHEFELGGFKTTATLTTAGVVVEPVALRTLGADGVLGLIAIWQLSAFAAKHGYRGFSRPAPLSELRQAVNLVNRMQGPPYTTGSVEELIPRIHDDFKNFWDTFQPGEETVAA